MSVTSSSSRVLSRNSCSDVRMCLALSGAEFRMEASNSNSSRRAEANCRSDYLNRERLRSCSIASCVHFARSASSAFGPFEMCVRSVTISPATVVISDFMEEISASYIASLCYEESEYGILLSMYKLAVQSTRALTLMKVSAP